MGVFTEKDYKSAIRSRIKELQTRRKGLSLKKLAARIRIQYTYLSKVMNDRDSHLSEERIFQLCQVLEWGPAETEFVMLMRGHAVADHPEWREELFKRIENARRIRKLNSDVQDFQADRMMQEMKYLFDPLSTVTLTALSIPEYRKNPRLLCPQLGIPPERLKQILRSLSDVEMIELDTDGFMVKKLLKSRTHFGRNHPLMRVHQSLLKSTIQSQLMRTSEEDKHSLLVTFNLDRDGYQKLQEEFSSFLKRAEEIAGRARDDGVYQLSFDLFRWL